MKGPTFRVGSPTLGILTLEDGQRIPVIVPRDALVTVLSSPREGDRLVDVHWEGQSLMMFFQDLQSRGKQVDAAHS